MLYTSLEDVAYFYIEAYVYSKFHHMKCTYKLDDFTRNTKMSFVM